MSIVIGAGGSAALGPFARLRMAQPPRTLTNSASASSSAAGLRELLDHVVRLRYELERWEDVTRFGRRNVGTSSERVAVGSTSPLALEDGLAAQLRSTAEINTVATSFGPFAPAFAGSSTVEVTIDGVYDGSRGDTTLTFKVKKGGVIGVDNVILDVFAGSTKIDTIPIGAADSPTATTVGVTVSLGPGTLVSGDTFDVEVRSSVGSVVNPNGSFDGSGDQDPNLDPGFSIIDGSFRVNGVIISVGRSDSLNAVLERITASSAGVTASFDAASERVVLLQKTVGAAPTITVGDDTSGFLAAFKLGAAAVVPGRDPGESSPIRDVPTLAGIRSGTFSINGIEFGVDVAVDSLDDVIDRINLANAGVTARYDPVSDGLSIVADDPTAQVTLDDGTSGFFSGVAILPTTYVPEATEAARSQAFLPRRRAFERLVQEVSSALGQLFDLRLSGLAAGSAGRIRAQIEQSVRQVFEKNLGDAQARRLRSGVGIDFDFGGERILRFDRDRFSRALSQDPTKVRDLLVGSADADTDGLAEALLRAVRSTETELRKQIAGDGAVGTNVDLLA